MEFGGSTIILLLEKEKVEIFPELFQWTEEGCETIVHMGETIGKPNSKRIFRWIEKTAKYCIF